jgi:hypothetical protein
LYNPDQQKIFEVHLNSQVSLSQTLTPGSSREAKAGSSMTLNSYLYQQPGVVERLTQGDGRTVQDYRKRAAGHIMDFESAFAEDELGRRKNQARM